MDEQEIAAALGWMMVASGALAMMLSSVFSRHGYKATTAGLLLGFLGLLIAGPYMGCCGGAGTDAGQVRVLSLSPL